MICCHLSHVMLPTKFGFAQFDILVWILSLLARHRRLGSLWFQPICLSVCPPLFLKGHKWFQVGLIVQVFLNFFLSSISSFLHCQSNTLNTYLHGELFLPFATVYFWGYLIMYCQFLVIIYYHLQITDLSIILFQDGWSLSVTYPNLESACESTNFSLCLLYKMKNNLNS